MEITSETSLQKEFKRKMRDIKTYLTERLANLTKLQHKQEDSRKQQQIDKKLKNHRMIDQDSNNKRKQKQKQKHTRNWKE